jgi:transaldolase
MTTSLSSLRVKLYADGASTQEMIRLGDKPYIAGYTTNPSLIRKLGAKGYEAWCRDAANVAGLKPISIEVLADNFTEMKRQALKIASWGENVYVKIPVTNSKGESSLPLIAELAMDGVKLNITALLTSAQVMDAMNAVSLGKASILSLFCGRIADTGNNPFQLMQWCSKGMKGIGVKNTKLLWASTREVFNIIQADQAGADIITVPPDILAKAEKLLGYDLDKLSLETVQMFEKDAREAGYTL